MVAGRGMCVCVCVGLVGWYVGFEEVGRWEDGKIGGGGLI